MGAKLRRDIFGELYGRRGLQAASSCARSGVYLPAGTTVHIVGGTFRFLSESMHRTILDYPDLVLAEGVCALTWPHQGGGAIRIMLGDGVDASPVDRMRYQIHAMLSADQGAVEAGEVVRLDAGCVVTIAGPIEWDECGADSGESSTTEQGAPAYSTGKIVGVGVAGLLAGALIGWALS